MNIQSVNIYRLTITNVLTHTVSEQQHLILRFVNPWSVVCLYFNALELVDYPLRQQELIRVAAECWWWICMAIRRGTWCHLTVQQTIVNE